MRRGFGIVSLLVTVILIAVVGVIAYQAGWSDGFSQHVPQGTTAVAPYPYYGFYGPHFFGFGWILGLLFFLFLGFIFFRIVAFGLFGGRRGWGYGRGWGHYGGGVPPAIDERMKEWHRQAHGDAAPTTPSSPPPPPVPDK
jgi:hypothetical protein